MWEDIKWICSRGWEWISSFRPQPPQRADFEALVTAQQKAMEAQAGRYEAVIVALETRNTMFIGQLEIRQAAVITLQDNRIKELETKERECTENLRSANRRIDGRDAKIKSMEAKINSLEERLSEAERVKAIRDDPGYKDRSMQQTKLLLEEEREGKGG